MSTDKRREAEREARRARRLAERAEVRAERKAAQAQRAEERARELSRRASGRRGRTESRRGRGIDEMLDDVNERAEEWIEDQLEGATAEVEKHTPESERAAERVAEIAAEAGRGAKDSRKAARGEAQAYTDEDWENWSDWSSWFGGSTTESKRERRARRHAERARRRKLRRRGRDSKRGLYRDDKRGHIFGVCAGIADYLYMETWQIRMAAMAGLFFFPGVTIPAYFIAYFVMDPKPYYRRVTDSFQELDDEPREETPMPRSQRRQRKQGETCSRDRIDNAQAMRGAKARFGDIEERLRAMESHVTSPTFELKRELRDLEGSDS